MAPLVRRPSLVLLTQKRFSATQYALLSSLFTLPPLARSALLARGLGGALLALASGGLVLCALEGLSGVRAGHGFDILALSAGLATAATLVARRGLAARP